MRVTLCTAGLLYSSPAAVVVHTTRRLWLAAAAGQGLLACTLGFTACFPFALRVQGTLPMGIAGGSAELLLRAAGDS